MQFTTKAVVAVVGGGPVGLFQSILLRNTLDCSVLLLEKRRDTLQHPQAHFINVRSMEILETHVPRVADHLKNSVSDMKHWRHFEYCTELGNTTSAVLGRLDMFGSDTNYESFRKISPSMPMHYPQDMLEKALEDEAIRVGVKVLRDARVCDMSMEKQSMEPFQLQYKNGSGVVKNVHCKYVIGADGAHSWIRQWAKIPLHGQGNLQYSMNIHFQSKEFSRMLESHPAMLYFLFHPKLVGVFISHGVRRGHWVLQLPYFPPFENTNDFTKDTCTSIITNAIGDQDIANAVRSDIQIHSIGPWEMKACTAAQFSKLPDSFNSLPQGESYIGSGLFLVGDAAHQMPPSGGFGMNTGIQDAHNLAMKLLSIQEGDPKHCHTTLSEYHKERHFIALQNTKLSLENYARVLRIPSSLGMPVSASALLSRLPATSYTPSTMVKSILHSAISLGRSTITPACSPTSLYGKRLRSIARNLIETRKSLGLLFWPFDIGYNYFKPIQINSKLLDACHDATQYTTSPHNTLQTGSRIPHFYMYSSREFLKGLSSVHLCTALPEQVSSQGILVASPNYLPKIPSSLLEKHTIVVLHDEVGTKESPYWDYYMKRPFWPNSWIAFILRPDGIVRSIL